NRLNQKTDEIDNLQKQNSELNKEINEIKNLHLELEKKLTDVKLSEENYKSQIRHLEKSLEDNSNDYLELNKRYYDNINNIRSDNNLYMNGNSVSNLYDSMSSYFDHDHNADFSLNFGKKYMNTDSLTGLSSPSIKARELNNENLKQIHKNIELINNHINMKVKSHLSKSS
ncbi:hypothetical protein PIROE2DRAFT_2548, partial [Piromyces sp. E2]